MVLPLLVSFAFALKGNFGVGGATRQTNDVLLTKLNDFYLGGVYISLVI